MTFAFTGTVTGGGGGAGGYAYLSSSQDLNAYNW